MESKSKRINTAEGSKEEMKSNSNNTLDQGGQLDAEEEKPKRLFSADDEKNSSKKKSKLSNVSKQSNVSRTKKKTSEQKRRKTPAFNNEVSIRQKPVSKVIKGEKDSQLRIISPTSTKSRTQNTKSPSNQNKVKNSGYKPSQETAATLNTGRSKQLKVRIVLFIRF